MRLDELVPEERRVGSDGGGFTAVGQLNMKGSSSTPALGLGRLGPAEFAPAHPPKKDFMRQNRDRVELQSSLAAAKRSVRDTSPDRQAAAAATSEPAIAAMPATSASHCLRSVGKFSLAVDPTRLTQWQYRTMTQDNPMHLATRRAAGGQMHRIVLRHRAVLPLRQARRIHRQRELAHGAQAVRGGGGGHRSDGGLARRGRCCLPIGRGVPHRSLRCRQRGLQLHPVPVLPHEVLLGWMRWRELCRPQPTKAERRRAAGALHV